MKILLEIENLETGYTTGKTHLVVSGELTLSVSEGELVCLVGPNGVGKSTLLRTITGLQPPLSGSIRFLGKELKEHSANERSQTIGVVLTERLQVGMMDARSLVSLGRYPFTGWLGSLSTDDLRIVDSVMRRIGIDHVADRSVSTLSDGERQKVMIARALAQEPRLVVLDEPTAFLDFPRRIEIMQLLRELAHQADHAVILSTHDLDLALTTADSLWLMTDDEKVKVGAPEDLILDGAFDSVFNRDRIRYNVRREKFVMQRDHVRDIKLLASGTREAMARHLLERIGFAATSRTPDDGLTLSDETTSWKVKDATNEWLLDTLYDVGKRLRIRQKDLRETEND